MQSLNLLWQTAYMGDPIPPLLIVVLTFIVTLIAEGRTGIWMRTLATPAKYWSLRIIAIILALIVGTIGGALWNGWPL